MPRKRKPKLVTQFLEDISREALERHEDIVRKFVAGRQGVYALYRRGKLYYAGLASNLRTRLKRHLKDHHRDSWDAFSVYLTIGNKHLGELESLIVRVVQPPGNIQRGRFSGAEDLWRRFGREIADKQRVERDRIMGREAVEIESRTKFSKAYKIRAGYKGKTVRARLRRDGKVRMNGKLYNSVSAAATAVRARNTNGWAFWHFERGPGDWVRISELRDA